MQLDIHGYYPNMLHSVVEEVFAARLPPDTYIRVLEVLRRQYEGSIGYNPGSQMVQIAGISVLNKFDHYCKEQLHIHHYLRYMDDIICIVEDTESAKAILSETANHLAKLGF